MSLRHDLIWWVYLDLFRWNFLQPVLPGGFLSREFLGCWARWGGGRHAVSKASVGMEAFVRKVLDAVPLKHVPELLELVKGSLQKKVKIGTLCSGSDCVVDILKAIWSQMWTLAKCLPETNIALAHGNSFPPKEKD